ncbi:hypothetical protein EYF80_027220 [Liparis tanakae]|uniref:Uncharacterized protein n=1 Tax=Liparis tanakae TaxID=230148 RepID=A0A4Z2H9E8_9TELE|nr:hypothetical protein EYF80_027220 [Liparis tanakae]
MNRIHKSAARVSTLLPSGLLRVWKPPAIAEQQMEAHNRIFPLRGFLFLCRVTLDSGPTL